MRIDLTDKVAVVTGAARGIGKACAELLLKNSARVIIADIDDEEGQKTAKEMSALGKCEFIRTDVASVESVGDLVERVVHEYERIDVLVNNAGIRVGGDRVNIHRFSDEDWEKIIRVDLSGVFYCSRAVARR